MANRFQATKAVRENVFVKLALFSCSGSGKTYSSLRLATGMAEEIKRMTGKEARILMGNTEASRGHYYADKFNYDIVDLSPPFEPEMYVDFINYAVAEGYSVLILDTASSEWEGKGGCLEIHQVMGGKYQDWLRVSPRHDKFIQALIQSPIHIIATMRSKDQYEVNKDEHGKVTVKKLGVGAKQRDGFEYEFTATLTLDGASHTAIAQKDNTGIFESDPLCILSEQHGAKIIKWANSGEAVDVSKKIEEAAKSYSEKHKIEEGIEAIESLVNALVEAGVTRTTIAEKIKSVYSVNGKPSANYKTINDVDTIEQVKKVLESLNNKGEE